MLRGQGWARSSPLLKGCLTAAALVASADLAVSLARRATIDRILAELKNQHGFDLGQAAEAFQKAVLKLKAGGSAAHAVAFSSLAKLADDTAAADLVLRVSQLVALADDPPSPAARASVTEIARALGRPVPVLDSDPALPSAMPGQVIVVGNEKGGTGKSTTAIHIALGLAQRGNKVACIDLDGRQATLSRFLANRALASAGGGPRAPVVVPRYRRVEMSGLEDGGEAEEEARSRLNAALADLADHDIVVIDTPGFATRLAQLAHGAAQILVTPINDSFIDIDALADIDVQRREVKAPSAYSRFLWQERERRRRAGEPEIDWIVTRNRIGHLDSRNAREISELLTVLSRRLGFRLQPGFSERVVFRQLFFRGLTLFDLTEKDLPHGSQASFLHARREVEELVDAVSRAADRSTLSRPD